MMRYAVRKNGRDHAEFVYARDAFDYIRSDAARDWISIEPLAPGELKRRRDQGQEVVKRDGKHSVDVYPIESYAVVSLHEDERKVVGVNGHGHAILEKLKQP